MSVCFYDKRGNRLPVNVYAASSDAVKNAIMELVADGKLEIPYMSEEAVKEVCMPLYNKKWIQIGDSNTNWFGTMDDGTGILDIIKKTEKIASVTNFGTAGATWAVADGEDENTTANSSAVGKVNQILADAGVTDETTVLDNYDIITIMMGTNDSVGGGDWTSTDVTTMCGAMHYCLKRLCYYYRHAAIGIILPPQNDDASYDSDKNDLIAKIAGYYGVPVLDAFHAARIIPNYKTGDVGTGTGPWYLGDGLHIGEYGRQQLARIQGAWMRTI